MLVLIVNGLLCSSKSVVRVRIESLHVRASQEGSEGLKHEQDWTRADYFLGETVLYSPELLSHIVGRLMAIQNPYNVGVAHICSSFNCKATDFVAVDPANSINILWRWSTSFGDWIMFAHDVLEDVLWAFHPTREGKDGTECGKMAFGSFHPKRAVTRSGSNSPTLFNRQLKCTMSSAISLLCVFEEIVVSGHLPSSVPLPVGESYEPTYSKLIGHFVCCD
jgi:hypothetical protein